MTIGARWLIILLLLIVLVTVWSRFGKRLLQGSWKQRVAEWKHLFLIAIVIYFCISLILTVRKYWLSEP